jgi:hypothetical protein
MSTNEEQPTLAWLAPGDPQNPFEVAVVDCRSIAHNMASYTDDPQIIANFFGLRRSKASDLAGKEPAEPMVVPCKFSIACGALTEGALLDGPLFLAPEMEHKWDFFALGGKVYTRRSWTGQVVHVADAEPLNNGRLAFGKVACAANSVFDDANFAVAQLHFLLSTYLERRLRPFPIPPVQAQDDPETIGLGGWSFYGRVAQFGCLHDAYPMGEE